MKFSSHADFKTREIMTGGVSTPLIGKSPGNREKNNSVSDNKANGCISKLPVTEKCLTQKWLKVELQIWEERKFLVTFSKHLSCQSLARSFRILVRDATLSRYILPLSPFHFQSRVVCFPSVCILLEPNKQSEMGRLDSKISVHPSSLQQLPLKL